ncbi:long-chain acyl-CoA synthetase [Catellatospora sp. IY07-71]|uniref:class I adenylate-forming enzyme family protein n=1 Tax=Catellatospora sp. IY07-71 TaxID=2728827 RepID=UPI001BB40727|nr:AMP-binding protein [Catellatospora sp. IY07-71]BCJ71310.1 long-chain acyl-CoA synthetase [Catellatospora sp. IY07-71]
MNLATLLRNHAAARPDRIALRAGEETLTWAQWDARVDAAARGLRALALPASAGHPARVAIALRNDLDFAVTLLAVLRAGHVAVPCNPGLTARELRHVLADSGAELLVAPAALRAGLAGAVPQGLDRLPSAEGAPPAETAPAEDRGDGLALLLYTSGTEGAPKGAMLPHGALLANHRQLAAVEPPPLGPDDVVLLAIPLFHAYGLNTGLGEVLFHGACGVLVADFDAAGTAALIAEHRITVLVGVPPMFLAWSALPEVGERLGSVRLAVCGAAALEPAAAARFTELTGHTVQIGYGLTETAPVLTSTIAAPAVKPGSIGRALPGVELRLVNRAGEDVWRAGEALAADDEDELDLDVPDSPGTDPGEIVVRGENVFAGYWPDGRDGPDAAGWWPTRDVAYADGDGDLFLVDRLGELILVSGFNVYPAEVEQVLLAHPAVAQAAVLGAPHPMTGQQVRAVVVPAPRSEVTAAELAAHCARNLARFKCPSEIEFADALPHSVIGKVRKGMLRE